MSAWADYFKLRLPRQGSTPGDPRDRSSANATGAAAPAGPGCAATGPSPGRPTFAITHRQNHRRRPAHDATGEHAGDAGHTVLIHDDVAVFVQLELGTGRSEQRIRACADGDSTTSHGSTNSEPGTGSRPRAARCIGLAKLHFHALEAGDPALLVADDFRRRGEVFEADALLFGMMNFLRARRQFRLRAAIDDHRLRCAETLGRAHSVHRHVAAADHRDAPAVQHRRVGMGKLVGGHEVDAGEILVGGIDAFQVLAGSDHEDRQAGTVGDEDHIKKELFLQLRIRGSVRPMMTLHSIFTPASVRRSTSCSTIFLGSRNSGMP